MNSSRRNFLRNSSLAGASLLTAPLLQGSTERTKPSEATRPFNLKYAPYFGMFRNHTGDDLADQIRFCHDTGFRAMFDNGLLGRSEAEQTLMASELNRNGMELGPFVLYADFGTTSFVLNKPEIKEMLINKMKEGVEVAKRTGVKWALVVPGRFDERLHRDFQMANIIDNLRICCDVVEKEGLTLVIEPLNTIRDHPGLVLTSIPQAYSICRAVNRPSCKIINDLYHQQITEGNLIPNIDAAWEEIAAFHCGDHPGRQEPGTGEINYKNVFGHLFHRNYQGVICMEHGISTEGKAGEARLIEAYREADSFI